MKFNSYIHNEYMKCVYWDLIFIQIGHKICQFVNILMFLANSCSDSLTHFFCKLDICLLTFSVNWAFVY